MERSGTAIWKAAVYSLIVGNIIAYSNPSRLRLCIPASWYDLTSLWVGSMSLRGSTPLVSKRLEPRLQADGGVGVVAKHD